MPSESYVQGRRIRETQAALIAVKAQESKAKYEANRASLADCLQRSYQKSTC